MERVELVDCGVQFECDYWVGLVRCADMSVIIGLLFARSDVVPRNGSIGVPDECSRFGWLGVAGVCE